MQVPPRLFSATGAMKVFPMVDNPAPRRSAEPSVDRLSRELALGREPAESPWSGLSPAQRVCLERTARSLTAPHRLVLRARTVLAMADGRTVTSTARLLRTTTRTVRLWCDRFAAGGLEALAHDAPGRGRRPGFDPATEKAVLCALRTWVRPDGPRWTVRSLADAAGTSRATVHRICAAHGVKPSDPGGARRPPDLDTGGGGARLPLPRETGSQS
jgi:hypothetical protein